jgi:hypothetical protein
MDEATHTRGEPTPEETAELLNLLTEDERRNLGAFIEYGKKKLKEHIERQWQIAESYDRD